MCGISVGHCMPTLTIHQRHSEGGRTVFKELCLLRVYYSGSQTHRGRWDRIKRAGLGPFVCVCARAVELDVALLFIVERALLAKEDLPPLVLWNPIFLIQLTLFWTCAHTVCVKKRRSCFSKGVSTGEENVFRVRCGLHVWQRVWGAEQPARQPGITVNEAEQTKPPPLSDEFRVRVIRPSLSWPVWDHPYCKYGQVLNRQSQHRSLAFELHFLATFRVNKKSKVQMLHANKHFRTACRYMLLRCFVWNVSRDRDSERSEAGGMLVLSQETVCVSAVYLPSEFMSKCGMHR